MLEITVRVDGADRMALQLATESGKVLDAVALEFERFGEEVVSLANRIAPSGATHQLRGSYDTRTERNPNSVRTEVGTAVRHGRHVEYGTRPGYAPPVAALEQWVRVKLAGAAAAYAQAEGRSTARTLSLAYAIQNSIRRRGTSSWARVQVGQPSPQLGTYGYRTLERAAQRRLGTLFHRLKKLEAKYGG